MCAGLESDPHRIGPETPTKQRLTGERSHHSESRLIHQRPEGPFDGLAEGEVGFDEPDAFDRESSLGGESERAPASLDHHSHLAAGSQGGGGESSPTRCWSVLDCDCLPSGDLVEGRVGEDRKSTRLNSSHGYI